MKKTGRKGCPFFDRQEASCNADGEPYIPSSFEIRNYCKKHEHKKCPFFVDLNVWTFLNSELF